MAVTELSIGWVDPWIGLGRFHCGRSVNISKDYVMHLKHGYIRFGCTKQLNLLVASGWVGLDLNFSSGWVSQLMGWVGSGHIK